jgi:plastocyanin
VYALVGGDPLRDQLAVTTPHGSVFRPTELTAAPHSSVTLTYENDSPIAHNVHVFAGPNAASPSLGATPIEPGPDSVHAITIQTGDPGTYFFQCDVHPDTMTGTITVKSMEAAS